MVEVFVQQLKRILISRKQYKKLIYSTAGTYSFTRPSGVTDFILTMVGGGGGGGSSAQWDGGGGISNGTAGSPGGLSKIVSDGIDEIICAGGGAGGAYSAGTPSAGFGNTNIIGAAGGGGGGAYYSGAGSNGGSTNDNTGGNGGAADTDGLSSTSNTEFPLASMGGLAGTQIKNPLPANTKYSDSFGRGGKGGIIFTYYGGGDGGNGGIILKLPIIIASDTTTIQLVVGAGGAGGGPQSNVPWYRNAGQNGYDGAIILEWWE